MKRTVTDIDEKVLKKVYEDNNIALYEYTPSVVALFYCYMEPISFVRRVRMISECLKKGRYKVYYLSVDGQLVGYNVLTRGGRRLTYSTKKDIVSGPVFITPEHRCKGYNKLMQKLSFLYCSFQYEYVYNWVEKTNIPSIKSGEKIGFKKVGEINVVGITHKLVPTSNGTCNVYRLPYELLNNVDK